MKPLAILLALFTVAITSVDAQTRFVQGAGGGATSSSETLVYGTVGQSNAGRVMSQQTLGSVGFWMTTLQRDAPDTGTLRLELSELSMVAGGYDWVRLFIDPKQSLTVLDSEDTLLLRLKYQATCAEYLDGDPAYDGDSASIQIAIDSSDFRTGIPILIYFRGRIGNVIGTDIRVTDVFLKDGTRIPYQCNVGRISIKFLCYEGGHVRLVQDIDKPQIQSVAPNPSSVSIDVHVSNVQNANALEVHDMIGQVVFRQAISNTSSQTIGIDVSAFSSGAYTVHLISDAGISSSTFMVSR